MLESSKNIFSLKRETENILTEVEKAPYTFESVEQGALSLTGIGEETFPFVAKYLEGAKPSAAEKLLHIVELINDYSYTDILRRFLCNRSVSQDMKIEYLATLKTYEPLHNSELKHFFDNAETAFFAWVERVLNNYYEREFRAISLLEEFLSGGEEKSGLLKEVVKRFAKKAIPLLSDLAYSDNKELANVAIAELGRIDEPQAVVALKEVCAYSWRAEPVKQAQKVLRRRLFLGIDDSAIVAGPASDLSPESCRAFISPVDSQGDAALCLIVEGKGDRSETLCIVYSDEAGIIDAYGSRRIKKRDISQMIDEIKTEEEALVQVNLDYFFQLLNNALSLNEKYDFPLPLEFCYRKDMLKGHLDPQPFMPDFSLSLLRRIRKDTSLLEEGGALLEKDAFAQWPMSSYSSFDYAEQWLHVKKVRPLSLTDKTYTNQFSFEVLLPNKELIGKRLISMVHFLEKTGDIDGAEISLASALELHSKTGRQFIEIPFIKALSEKSIEYCITQINEGSDPREYYEDID